MQFFFQFVDFFALFLVFFGLAFFLLRGFFQWYLSLPALQKGMVSLQSEVSVLTKQIQGLQEEVSRFGQENSSLDLSHADRLQKVAQETLVQTEKKRPKLDPDFRLIDPKVKLEIDRRREQGACIFCGEPALPGQLYCSTAHQEKYVQGNIVEPVNLPFSLQDSDN